MTKVRLNHLGTGRWNNCDYRSFVFQNAASFRKPTVSQFESTLPCANCLANKNGGRTLNLLGNALVCIIDNQEMRANTDIACVRGTNQTYDIELPRARLFRHNSML